MYISYGLAALCGLLAAALSWVINGKLLTIFGNNKCVIFFGPAVEEGLKTGLAVALGAPLILCHTSFGVVEAVWELNAYKRGKVAAVFALISHSFYGWLVFSVAQKISIYIAVIVAYTVHMLWNYMVLHYQRLKASK